MSARNKLLLVSIAVATTLMAVAWMNSYPLSTSYVSDVVFNHVSILYWLSLPLLLGSLYVLSVSSQSTGVKWATCVGIVLTIYSLSYFYYMIPGSDSRAFRGLDEYVIRTNDLDPTKTQHDYYQWPSYFMLSSMMTSIGGMELRIVEFCIYTLVGFVLASAVYLYASAADKKDGSLAVASFFVGMYYFLNYQAVPFTLAFALLLLLFVLENRPRTSGSTAAMLALFVGINFTHVFVPVFFILYLAIRFVLRRDIRYGKLFLVSSGTYLAIQLLQAPYSFGSLLNAVLQAEYDITGMVIATLTPVSNPLDGIAQIFSRVITLAVLGVPVVGFALSFLEGGISDNHKALFLTGVVYTAMGLVFRLFGTRAIPLVFLPVTLGSSYLLRTRLGFLVKPFFLIALVLFTFVPIHGTFETPQIMYQTLESYDIDNFFLDHYNLTSPGLVLAHFREITYFIAKEPDLALSFEGDVYSRLFPRPGQYHTIVYTTGLGINLAKYNYTIESIVFREKLNIVYSSGLSSIAIRSVDLVTSSQR